MTAPELTGRLEDPRTYANALFALLQTGEATRYDDSVTQLEHALQSATLAQSEGASAHLVVAALFHDIGHLLLEEHDQRHDFLHDDLEHEKLGARILARGFGANVGGPVSLHVAAKRYLVTTDPDYLACLSLSSRRSLSVQGGLLSASEASRFLRHPHSHDAIKLRRWDDRAKVRDRSTPNLDHWRPVVLGLLGDLPRRKASTRRSAAAKGIALY
jgi:phosphonate degradation associated HDIG domain protein